jgi:hypothetical protein
MRALLVTVSRNLVAVASAGEAPNVAPQCRAPAKIDDARRLKSALILWLYLPLSYYHRTLAVAVGISNGRATSSNFVTECLINDVTSGALIWSAELGVALA